MTTRLSDEMLIAYMDGELPPEQARDVEAQVAADIELAAMVEALRKESSALRVAFNEPLRTPVPDRLSKLFDAPAVPVALALETRVSGKPATWRNPDSGSYGTVEPVRTFRAANGQWCREYIQTADLAAELFQPARRRAIACRDPDGQWRTRLELAKTDS